MLLRPRKFKYKNSHKRRFFRFFTDSKFNYGYIGLRLLRPVRLNSKQIFRFKLFLKKSSRRSDKTLRKVWFNLFPHLPITRKVKGSRMGKGKGKLDGWSSEVPAGLNLVEFKNLRYGRSVYYCRQILYKFPSSAYIVSKRSKFIPLVLDNSIQVPYDIVW